MIVDDILALDGLIAKISFGRRRGGGGGGGGGGRA